MKKAPKQQTANKTNPFVLVAIGILVIWLATISCLMANFYAYHQDMARTAGETNVWLMGEMNKLHQRIYKLEHQH